MEARGLLKALRARLGLTQEQLAEKASLLRQEINKIETGKNQVTTIRLVKALAVAADTSLEDMAAYFGQEIPLEELWRRADARRSRARAGAVGGDPDDPDPPRSEAADICRRGGVSLDAINSVLAEPPASRTTLEWIEVIRLRELQMRRFADPPKPAPTRRRS